MGTMQDLGEAVPRSQKLSQAQRLYRAIRSDILSAELRPGSVVVESELAREHGVSKTPVREALQMLVVEGLISLLPQRGYLVRTMGFTEIRDVMELRLIIEPPLIAAAARNVTPELVQAMRQRLQEQFSENSTLKDWTDAAREFHMIAVRASKNERAVGLVAGLFDETTRMHHLLPQAVNHLRSSEEHDAHLAILRAIEAGDPEAASEAMTAHLRESNDSLLKAFYTG